MSVRVNLLPQEQFARQAAARQRNGLLLGVLAVLLVLGAVTVWQNGRIHEAEERLTDEQAVLLALQGEVNELAEFSELESRVQESDELIAGALGNEVSLAGVLQDVASVMPSDAQLDSLTLSMQPDVPVAGVESSSYGTLTATGQSLNNHAPGLERLLLEFDKVAAFHDLFFSSSVLTDPDEPYVTFSVEAQLGPEVLTGRYAGGAPEDLR